jgi:putative ABC transport system permease protein
VGASPGRILRLVLGDGIALASLGVLLGLAVAYASGSALQGLLAGVRPTDLVTYAAGAVAALTMAISGSLAPALRALRIDPKTALRES